MPFRDRSDAGRQLAMALAKYKAQKPVVLALPRGGVPVAEEVALALDAPLDLILVRKIGVPFQPELAMGAIVDGEAPIAVRNEDVIREAGISDAQFEAVRDAEFAEIERRRERYLAGRQRAVISGHTAIVIDDGIATGATTRAALRATRMREPKRLVLAVPVAPTELFPNCAMRPTTSYVLSITTPSALSDTIMAIFGRFRIRKSSVFLDDFPCKSRRDPNCLPHKQYEVYIGAPRERRWNLDDHTRSPCLPRSCTVDACGPLSPCSSANVTREPTLKRENPSSRTLLRWK